MNSKTDQEILSQLLDELTSLIDEYHQSLEQDKIFEILKDIRMRIKEVQRKIDTIRSSQTSHTNQ